MYITFSPQGLSPAVSEPLVKVSEQKHHLHSFLSSARDHYRDKRKSDHQRKSNIPVIEPWVASHEAPGWIPFLSSVIKFESGSKAHGKVGRGSL